MSSITLNGDTSGSVQLTVPAVAGSSVITVPAGTGTVAVQGVSTNIVQSTAQASTSGTAINFTGIPSYTKRITLIFQGVRGSGGSLFIAQIGSGSYTTSGYVSSNAYTGASTAMTTSTVGFLLDEVHGSSDFFSGKAEIVNITSNTWVYSSIMARADGYVFMGGGYVSLSGVITQLRATFVNGTDTFTAGNINIFYE